jgi:hypothetical protein
MLLQVVSLYVKNGSADYNKGDIMKSTTDKDLFTLLGKFEQQQKMPPVESWNPTREGEIDILINAKGEWYHEGGYFKRQDLARMFASILRKDGEDYFLVTPAEKLKIQVEDVPFSIVLMSEEEGVLSFITSLGDEVTMSADHPMEFRKAAPLPEGGAEFIPYVMIRNNLWAKFNQSTYYELINLAQETAEGYVVCSGDYEVKILV